MVDVLGRDPRLHLREWQHCSSAIGNAKIFYVRSGNSTQLVDGEQAHRYISQHWGP